MKKFIEKLFGLTELNESIKHHTKNVQELTRDYWDMKHEILLLESKKYILYQEMNIDYLKCYKKDLLNEIDTLHSERRNLVEKVCNLKKELESK